MNVIEIIPVDSETQALLVGSDPQQQKEIRAQLRKDLSLSMSDSVTLVQRLAAGEQGPRRGRSPASGLPRSIPTS